MMLFILFVTMNDHSILFTWCDDESFNKGIYIVISSTFVWMNSYSQKIILEKWKVSFHLFYSYVILEFIGTIQIIWKSFRSVILLKWVWHITIYFFEHFLQTMLPFRYAVLVWMLSGKKNARLYCCIKFRERKKIPQV